MAFQHVFLWLVIAWSILSASVCEISDAVDHDDDFDNDKSRKSAKMFNFASQTAGAVVLDKSPPSAKGYSNLLNDDKDKYGISPCSENKWIVIGLSEDVLITSVAIANYERYSSMLKEFRLYAANSYPSDQWIDLGSYTAEARLGEQLFNVTNHAAAHTRYLKIKFKSHYESDALCTLSQIKVHGMTVIASFKQEVEWSDSERRDMLHQLSNDEVLRGGGDGEALEGVAAGNETAAGNDTESAASTDNQIRTNVTVEVADGALSSSSSGDITSSTEPSAAKEQTIDSHNNLVDAVESEVQVPEVLPVEEAKAPVLTTGKDATTASLLLSQQQQQQQRGAETAVDSVLSPAIPSNGSAEHLTESQVTGSVVEIAVPDSDRSPTLSPPSEAVATSADDAHSLSAATISPNSTVAVLSHTTNSSSQSGNSSTNSNMNATSSSNATTIAIVVNTSSSSSSMVGGVDGLLGLVLRQVGDLLLWTNVTEAMEVSEEGAANHTLTVVGEVEESQPVVAINATHLVVGNATDDTPPATSLAVPDDLHSLVELSVAESASTDVAGVHGDATASLTTDALDTTSDHSIAQLLSVNLPTPQGAVGGVSDDTRRTVVTSPDNTGPVDLARQPQMTPFEAPGGLNSTSPENETTHSELMDSEEEDKARSNQTTHSVDGGNALNVTGAASTGSVISVEAEEVLTHAADPVTAPSLGTSLDSNDSQLLVVGADSRSPSFAGNTTPVAPSDEGHSLSGSIASGVTGLAGSGASLLPSPHGANSSSPIAALMLNCFETMRLSDFKAKMTAKLNRSREALEDSPLLGGGGNNVFRLLMARIKALELENAIMDMYVLQLTDCYRAVTRDLQQGLVAVNESRSRSDETGATSLELAPRISPPDRENGTVSSESGLSLYGLVSQWLGVLADYLLGGGDYDALRSAWSQADEYLQLHLLQVVLGMALLCLLSMALSSLLLCVVLFRSSSSSARKLTAPQ